MALHGTTLIDVLNTAWVGGFRTQSDFARRNANLVAMAASDGLITTKLAAGLYGGQWNITEAGLHHLNRLKGI